MRPQCIVVGLVYPSMIGFYLWVTNSQHLFNQWGVVHCFASLTVMFVHLICCLPISWALIESTMRGRFVFTGSASTTTQVLLALLCAACCICLLRTLPQVSAFLLENDTGFELRAAVRIVLCVLATLPIVSLFYCMEERLRVKASLAAKFFMVLTGVYLASLYGWKQSQLARQALQTSSNSVRLAVSLKSLCKLIELNSSPLALAEVHAQEPRGAIDGDSHYPRVRMKSLQEQVNRLENEVAAFVEAGLRAAEFDSQWNHQQLQSPSKIAANLISLDRFQEAETVLALLPNDSQDATLFRALIAKEREDWGLLLRYSESLLSTQSNTEFTIYSLKGDALVGLKRSSEAISFYEQVFEECHSCKADAAIRIARLAMDQGDRSLAWHYIDEIQEHSPERIEEVQSLKRTLATTACSIRSQSR